MKKNPKRIIFSISGGVGKNIMATAVVNSIKEQYPKADIIVATPHTVVWQNNPDILEAINFVDNDDFYEKFIKDQDVLYFANDPYLHQDFIYKREHLVETWCKQFGIKYNGSKPKLYFTEEEKQAVKEKLPKDKKLFFIQVSGGASNQQYPISWTRDLPFDLAQKVADSMIEKGYEVVQIRRKDQYALNNAPWIDLNMREAMCALNYADKLLLIDSVIQHAAAALNKKSVVVWIGHRPENFGYKMHTNIISSAPIKFRHNIDSFLDHYDLTGRLNECPYDTNELFRFEDIKEKLK